MGVEILPIGSSHISRRVSCISPFFDLIRHEGEEISVATTAPHHSSPAYDYAICYTNIAFCLTGNPTIPPTNGIVWRSIARWSQSWKGLRW